MEQQQCPICRKLVECSIPKSINFVDPQRFIVRLGKSSNVPAAQHANRLGNHNQIDSTVSIYIGYFDSEIPINERDPTVAGCQYLLKEVRIKWYISDQIQDKISLFTNSLALYESNFALLLWQHLLTRFVGMREITDWLQDNKSMQPDYVAGNSFLNKVATGFDRLWVSYKLSRRNVQTNDIYQNTHCWDLICCISQQTEHNPAKRIASILPLQYIIQQDIVPYFIQYHQEMDPLDAGYYSQQENQNRSTQSIFGSQRAHHSELDPQIQFSEMVPQMDFSELDPDDPDYQEIQLYFQQAMQNLENQ